MNQIRFDYGTVVEQTLPESCHSQAFSCAQLCIFKNLNVWEKLGKLVLRERIELSTSPLPMEFLSFDKALNLR